MAHKINQEICTNCGACEIECCYDAINNENGFFVINQETCVECGYCAAICPVEAIEDSC